MDPFAIKKRLEDYEKMLQYYTVMRTKNKMKDLKVEYEEWWEVIREYFTKDLEKNLAQHRVDERIMKYKLEIYQKKNSNFVYGNVINTKALDKDEEVEARPNGTIQEEEMKIEEPQNLRRETIQKEEIQIEKPQDLRGGGQEEK